MKALGPGILGMVISGAGLLALVFLVLFGGHFQSPRGTQHVLQMRVQKALDGAGLEFARAAMRGQTAVLSGIAPNAAARARAERVALTAGGAGGAWRGPVARVRSSMTLAHTDVPPLWRAVRAGTRVTITGTAPSQVIADALAARARALFGPEFVASDVLVQPFSVKPGWQQAATESLHQLARLDRGDARLLPDRLYFFGEGVGRALEAAQRWRGAPAPDGMAMTIEIAPVGARDGEDSSSAIKACQAALDAFALSAPAAFDGQVDPAQRQMAVDQLAAIMRRCDQHRLAVTMAGASPEIANQRAEALARDLLLAAVDADHMRVQGLVNLARPRGVAVIVRAAGVARGEGDQ